MQSMSKNNKKALVTDILCKLRLCVLKTDVIIVFVKCCFLCVLVEFWWEKIGPLNDHLESTPKEKKMFWCRFGVDLMSIWCRFGVCTKSF